MSVNVGESSVSASAIYVGNTPLLVNRELASVRLRQLWSRAQSQAIRVLFVGSSTTQGGNASAAENRYVSLLSKCLQESYPSGLGTETPLQAQRDTVGYGKYTRVGIHTYNSGDGGKTSTNYLASTEPQNIVGLAPHVIFHMVGSNDYGTNVNPAVYESNLETTTQYFRDNIPDVLQIMVQPYAQYAHTYNYYWADYGAAQRNVANRHPYDTLFVDLSPEYFSRQVPSTDPLGLMDVDKVHQTDWGHLLMAQLLARELGLPAPIVMPKPNPINYTVFDNFDTPGNIIGSRTTKGNLAWFTVAGTSTTDAVKANGIATKTGGSPNIFVDLGVTTFTVDATLARLSTNPVTQGGGIVVRADSAFQGGMYLNTRITSAELGYSLYRGGTMLASSTAVLPSPGDRMRLSVTPTTVTATVNGIRLMQVADSLHGTTSTLAGLFLSRDVAFDDFGQRI